MWLKLEAVKGLEMRVKDKNCKRSNFKIKVDCTETDTGRSYGHGDGKRKNSKISRYGYVRHGSGMLALMAVGRSGPTWPEKARHGPKKARHGTSSGAWKKHDPARARSSGPWPGLGHFFWGKSRQSTARHGSARGQSFTVLFQQLSKNGRSPVTNVTE